jgi:hypothetical protein
MAQPQHRQTMAIGGCAFQSLTAKVEVHTREQLFGLIATAGEQGGPQALHQGFRLEPNRLAGLHQRKIGKILRWHAPHLVRTGNAGELHLFARLRTVEGDGAVGGEARHDFAEQTRRQGDGSAGLHLGGDAGLDAEAQVKAREAEAACTGIGGEQHIRQNGMGGACSHRPTHQLEAGVEFRLGADQLHGACCGAWEGPYGLSTLPQGGLIRNIGSPAHLRSSTV